MTTFGTIFAVYYDLHRIYLVPTETIEIFMCRSCTYYFMCAGLSGGAASAAVACATLDQANDAAHDTGSLH